MDTTEAGDGEVEVDVIYDGRQMPTRVSRSGQLHQVSFMPEGPGVYSIEVEFANMDVPGKLSFSSCFSRSYCFTVESAIGIMTLSVRLSDCNAVYCAVKGRCTGLNVVLACS